MTKSTLYYSPEYKSKIINLLLDNEDFIKLINPAPSKCPDLDIIDVLVGGEWKIDGKRYTEQGHIFDHNFVDETTMDEKTFVFEETTIDNVYQNMFVNFSLYICIFTKKNLVRLNRTSVPTAKEVRDMGYFASNVNGNRIDVLCDIVDRIINGNSSLNSLGDIKPADRNFMTLFTPNVNYYGKCLKYTVQNYNISGDCDV